MENVNWIDFIFDVFDKLTSLIAVLWDFLTEAYTINLPQWLNDLIGLPDISFSVWAALGGVGIVAIILWGIFS